LLGAIACTQAFKVELPGVNITGKGAMCVDEKYMPVRYLTKDPAFSAQCAHKLWGGVVKAQVQGGVQIAFGFVRNDITPTRNLKVGEVVAKFDLDYQPGEFKEFNSPDPEFLDSKFSALDCSTAYVSLAMAVELPGDSATTEPVFQVIAVQDFVMEHCLQQDAKVFLEADFEPNSKLTIHLKQTADGNVPAVELSEVIKRLAFKVHDADLPPNGDGWPRGLLMFMTDREVQQCDEKSARMTALDQMLLYYPIDDAMAKDHFVSVFDDTNKAPAVEFGRMKETCLFCRDVTIVMAYDFLGRYNNNPCDSFKSFRTSIDCSALATAVTEGKQIPPLDFGQLVPNPITQGNSAWLRLCGVADGYKLLKIDGGTHRTAYRFVESPYELKGAGRVIVTAAIYNYFKTSQCPDILAKDELLNKEKALDSLGPMCKAFVTETLKTDNQYYPEFKEYLKGNCSSDPTVLRLFTYDKLHKDVQDTMSKGLCPDGGLRPEDAFNDDLSERASVDKFYKSWGASMARAVREDGANCGDEVQHDLCGYRAVASLMSTGQRLMANRDLWEEHAVHEDYGKSYDEAKPIFDAWLGVDTDAMRHCPRPDMWKPYNVYPAVWRMDEDGLLKGFFNGLNSKWCYTRVLRWSCPECSPDGHQVATTGTNTTNPAK